MDVNTLVASFKNSITGTTEAKAIVAVPAPVQAVIIGPVPTKTMWDEIKDAMTEEEKYRIPDVKRDPVAGLTKLDTKIESKARDMSVPYIYGDNTAKCVRDIKEFKEVAKARYAALEGFNMSNLIIAGGSVSGILTSSDTFSDIDLFLVGLHTEQAATDKINALAKHLAGYFKQWWMGMDVIRTERAISFVARGKPASWSGRKGVPETRKIQVVLRLYNSISEVVHGFDLGSCAFAYNGTDVFMTATAKIALQYGLNVVDMTKRKASYEYRMVKYWERGFGLVLPKLNTTRIARKTRNCGYWFRLGFLTTHALPKSSTNAINAEFLRLNKKDTPRSDYEDVKSDYFDPNCIATRNFLELKKAAPALSQLCAMGMYVDNMDVTTIPINLDQLVNVLDEAIKPTALNVIKLNLLFGKDITNTLVDAVVKRERVNSQALAKGFGDAVIARTQLPFKLMSEVDGTSLRRDNALQFQCVPESEWYGPKMFKPDRIVF